MSLKIGQKVEVTGKDVRGCVAYVGNTHFATGKWIGVVLDSPKGKNNGSVQGKTYFQCDENHGMFVRPSQLTMLDDNGQPIELKSGTSTSPSSSSGTPGDRRSSLRKRTEPTRLPVPGSGGAKTQHDVSAELSVTPIKESVQPSESATKRASFVETGFVETLKPQYTPGQALSPGIGFNVEERLTHMQQATEIDRLQSEIRDLNEKLETLRVKRAQDKEKLKEQDKLRLQLEQLLEFKSRIMDSQGSLQRDLARARQETREAIEARERHAEEMADLSETVEMATLDKEMAEEKAESLQMELDQANEKIESLTMDLELLKAEMSEQGTGDESSRGSASALEVKQLEQQNARLRETLVRLRDLSAHEKHEFQKLQKELELRRSEIQELSRTKEKLSARQEEMEQQIADLHEQVDAALGAEDMVESLTTKNLNLEEKVKDLEEAVADLEAISDMNEQLQEGSRELEMDLREELDLAHMAKREAYREKEAAQETLADRELTIAKFRELVQTLQDQCQELQDQLQRESSKPVSALPEMIDFKKMFAETKAHTKAIDLELRRIDVQQATQHVNYLTSFMPESFMARGGDHDAMLLLLLVPRLIRKADILVNQVRDKFTSVSTIDRAAVLRSHAVEQFSFRSRLSFSVYSLQTLLQQLLRSLNTCTPDTFLRIGVLYSDLALQEKAVDALVELLRRDQLDENVSTESLERCVGFCQAVMATHLPDATADHSQQLSDCCRALSAACDSLHTDASSIIALMQSGQQDSNAGKLLLELVSGSDMMRQQVKQSMRRLPQEGSVCNAKVAELGQGLQQNLDNTSRMMRALQETVRSCLQHVTASGDAESGVSLDKVMEFLHAAVDHVYEGEEQGPVETLHASLEQLQNRITNLSVTLQEGEYDMEVKREEKIIPPITLRAQLVKRELEETKMLKQKLETRETDIKELKKALKLKQEELSEMVIRKDLAESKLGNVHKDYGLNIEKLQRKFDDSQLLLKRKEKEFEETMDHLQADIDSLESERGELKEKLKSISKKALIEGLAKSVASSSSPASSPGGPSLPVTVRDSPMLVQELQYLRLALKHATNEVLRLQTAMARSTLQKLPALKVAKKPLDTLSEKSDDNSLNELSKKASNLLKEVHSVISCPKVVDISSRKGGEAPVLDKSTPAHQLIEDVSRVHNLRNQADKLQMEVLDQLMQHRVGAKALSGFSSFPSVELTKALHEKDAQIFARITVPAITNKNKIETGVIPLIVDIESLRKLHSKFSPSSL